MADAYQRCYHDLFDSPIGREYLPVVRAFAASHGEFTAMDALDYVCEQRGVADSWNVLNALDHLLTEGVIREVNDRSKILGQDRRYRTES